MIDRSKEPKIDPRNKPTHWVGICFVTKLALQLSEKRRNFSTNDESIDYPYEKIFNHLPHTLQKNYFQVD